MEEDLKVLVAEVQSRGEAREVQLKQELAEAKQAPTPELREEGVRQAYEKAMGAVVDDNKLLGRVLLEELRRRGWKEQ
jgi:predicted nucleic acid-binding Zn ribbon protein